MSLSRETIDRILPATGLPTPVELEGLYPRRSLQEGQKVTRLGPSPTGFFHLGGMITTLTNERLAHQSGGVFFLRIEDTDQERLVEGAVALVLRTFAEYGIKVDEGPLGLDGADVGAYGPYTQSQRAHIYKAFVRELLIKGLAYPCFCSSAELEEVRSMQESSNIRPGYYGKYAIWRDRPEEEVKAKLDAGVPFAIRLRAEGSYEKMMKIADVVKGDLYLPENDLDIVILKSGGLPTYHLAHVVDDHLMGTTHVVRGDEWLNSVPLHLQLFAALGWRAPKYGHTSPIQKLDEGSRRKLSKRKDPEASMAYYDEKGYPPVAVIEYLMNLANSNFEDWRRANPALPYGEFAFSLKKLGTTGALFDFVKLNAVSRDYISRLSAPEVYEAALAWARRHNPKLASLLQSDPAYAKAIFAIERSGAKVRKDIAAWGEVFGEIAYFYDSEFALTREAALALLPTVSPEVAAAAAKDFAASYTPAADKDAWFENVKRIAGALGYATDMKAYKATPAAFKGTVSEVAKIFRVLLTGRAETPDLHSVMAVLGEARCRKRLGLFQ